MPREFSRNRRVADQIQREIAEILRRDVSDPRLARATISGVEVSRDMAHAKVYVTFLEMDERVAEADLHALERASGFLRSGLARRLQIRSVPDLHFIHDTSTIRGIRLDALIDDAVARDRRDAADMPEHDETE